MRIMVGLLFLTSVVMSGCLIRSSTHDKESKPHVSISGERVHNRILLDEQFGDHFSKCNKFLLSDEFKNNGCIGITIGDEKKSKSFTKIIYFMEKNSISCEKSPEQERPADVEGIGFRLVLPVHHKRKHNPEYRHIDVWCPKDLAKVDISIQWRSTWRPPFSDLPFIQVDVINEHKDTTIPTNKHSFWVAHLGYVIYHHVELLNKWGERIGKKDVLFSIYE